MDREYRLLAKQKRIELRIGRSLNKAERKRLVSLIDERDWLLGRQDLLSETVYVSARVYNIQLNYMARTVQSECFPLAAWRWSAAMFENRWPQYS